MVDRESKSQSLVLTNPDREWILSELEQLYSEWQEWADKVSQIEDHPFDAQFQTEVWADGEENMQAHARLQAKTLTFLDNNIQGHGFIDGFDGKGCDRTDLRLAHRVKHRLQRLEILRDSLKYAVEEQSINKMIPESRLAFVSKHWKWFVGAILVPVLIALFL